MAREQTAEQQLTPDIVPTVFGAFAKGAGLVSFTANRAAQGNTQIGIEIVNGAGAVTRRAVANFGGAAPNGAEMTATINGLPGNVPVTVRGFRGDEGLADL